MGGGGGIVKLGGAWGSKVWVEVGGLKPRGTAAARMSGIRTQEKGGGRCVGVKD